MKIRNKVYKTEIVSLLIVSFLFLCTTYYKDNYEIFYTAYVNLDNLFRGNSIEAFGNKSLPYGVIHQWITEIWTLPSYILCRLAGIEFSAIIITIWNKLCIVLFYFLCICEMNKLADSLGIKSENKQWAVLLFTSNILVALPVFHIAQTDVIYLYLMLKGTEAYIKDDTKGFVLWYAIANSIKFIPIFVFIPLVLLKEKRILACARNIVLGCILIPIQQIWYRIVDIINGMIFSTSNIGVASLIESANEQAHASDSFYSKISSYVLFFEFPAVRKEYTASVLILGFGILCIYCYSKTKITHKGILWVIEASLLLFFLNVSPAPYWIVIMFPFVYLQMFLHESDNSTRRLNMILDKVFSWSLMVVYVMSTYWVYGGSQTFCGTVLEKIGIIPMGHVLQGQPNIAGYLNKLGINELMPIIVAICLASAVGYIAINCVDTNDDDVLPEKYACILRHGMLIVNIAVLYIWYIMNVILLGRY